MSIEYQLNELKQQLVACIESEELDEALINQLLRQCEQLFSDDNLANCSEQEIMALQGFSDEFNAIVAEVTKKVKLLKTDLNTLQSGKKMRDFYAK